MGIQEKEYFHLPQTLLTHVSSLRKFKTKIKGLGHQKIEFSMLNDEKKEKYLEINEYEITHRLKMANKVLRKLSLLFSHQISNCDRNDALTRYERNKIEKNMKYLISDSRKPNINTCKMCFLTFIHVAVNETFFLMLTETKLRLSKKVSLHEFAFYGYKLQQNNFCI